MEIPAGGQPGLAQQIRCPWPFIRQPSPRAFAAGGPEEPFTHLPEDSPKHRLIGTVTPTGPLGPATSGVKPFSLPPAPGPPDMITQILPRSLPCFGGLIHILGRGLQPRSRLPSLAPGKFLETDLMQGHPSTRKDSTGYRYTEHSPLACRPPRRVRPGLSWPTGDAKESSVSECQRPAACSSCRTWHGAHSPLSIRRWLSTGSQNPCPVPLLDLAVSQHPSSTPGVHPESSLIPLVLQVALLMKALMPPWGLHPHDLA